MATLLVILFAGLVVGVGIRVLVVAGEVWQLIWRLSLTVRAMLEQTKRQISAKLLDPRPTSSIG